ncbi:MAG TPA: hypothetical protein P5329_11790, partial [Candidatus Competibacteraceae bacterium]|nr:hypothetical protein [Candidatus Competibacteraceae bacterium]
MRHSLPHLTLPGVGQPDPGDQTAQARPVQRRPFRRFQARLAHGRGPRIARQRAVERLARAQGRRIGGVQGIAQHPGQ